MSLKVLGKWKHWGPSIDRAFNKIQTNIQRSHIVYPASPVSPKATSPKFPRHPHIAKLMKQEKAEESDSEADPDTDEEDYDGSEPIRFNPRELQVLRRSMRKWWRLAGLKGTPRCADELGEGELNVDWTKAIAPRLEGRIREVKRG